MSDAALSLFGKGGGTGKKATENTSTAEEGGLEAGGTCEENPDYVQAKWTALCDLKGRDRDKNAKTREFLQVLLRDPTFQDNSWQTSVADTYTKKKGTKGQWKMREKAEQEHGGGSTGKTAIDNGLKAGIFFERFIECEDGTKVSQIKVVEDEEEELHHIDVGRKARTGKAWMGTRSKKSSVHCVMGSARMMDAK